MNDTELLRVGAVVAALAVFFSDSLIGMARRAFAWSAASKKQGGEAVPADEDTSLADMRTILELASRLKARGCDAGVSLCQQLIDVMLGSPTPPKAKK